MAENYKEWPYKLPFALWEYRMSIRTYTREIAYSLAYEMEAVLAIKIAIPWPNMKS